MFDDEAELLASRPQLQFDIAEHYRIYFDDTDLLVIVNRVGWSVLCFDFSESIRCPLEQSEITISGTDTPEKLQKFSPIGYCEITVLPDEKFSKSDKKANLKINQELDRVDYLISIDEVKSAYSKLLLIRKGDKYNYGVIIRLLSHLSVEIQPEEYFNSF